MRRLQIMRLGGTPASRRDHHFQSGVLVIADEEGRPLPMQADNNLDCTVDGLPRFTVTFVVDGDGVVLGDGFALEPGGTLAEASAAYAALSPANRARFRAQYGLEQTPMQAAMDELTMAWRDNLRRAGIGGRISHPGGGPRYYESKDQS